MTIDRLNAVYAPLDEKRHALVAALKEAVPLPIKDGYFNGHYRKAQNGAYEKELYPIPVVTAEGLCDIEIEPDGVSVTTKSSRQRILSYCGTVLHETRFEAYGVEDFLSDYGNDLVAVKAALNRNDEPECFLTFSFPADVSVSELTRFVLSSSVRAFLLLIIP